MPKELFTGPRRSRGDASDELPVLTVPEGLPQLFVRTLAAGRRVEPLEDRLLGYIRAQRWFGAKGEEVRGVAVADAVRIRAGAHPVYLTVLSVRLPGRTDRYVLPLTTAHGETAAEVLTRHPHAALAWVDGPGGRALLHDATVDGGFWKALFDGWQRGGQGRSLRGLYTGSVAAPLRGARAAEVRPVGGEQSNSAAIVTTDHGARLFVKLYRRLESGTHPEVELLDHLARVGFRFVPRLLGTASFRRGEEEDVMGIVQEALPVDADGWTHALALVGRFYDRVAGAPPPDNPLPGGPLPGGPLPGGAETAPPAWLAAAAPELLALARALGVRTAEMHLALARAEAPALRPQPGNPDDTPAFVARVREEAMRTREMLEGHADTFGPRLPAAADWALALARLDTLQHVEATHLKIRLHGDFHLGQTVIVGGEVFVLDFEGEPARPLEERRRRDYALRDVAGMLRSLDYAASAPLLARADPGGRLQQAAGPLVRWCEAAFVDAYLLTSDREAFLLPQGVHRPLLWAYLLDKALYEVRYELNNRPEWAPIPLRSLLRLLREPAPSPAPVS